MVLLYMYGGQDLACCKSFKACTCRCQVVCNAGNNYMFICNRCSCSVYIADSSLACGLYNQYRDLINNIRGHRFQMMQIWIWFKDFVSAFPEHGSMTSDKQMSLNHQANHTSVSPMDFNHQQHFIVPCICPSPCLYSFLCNLQLYSFHGIKH